MILISSLSVWSISPTYKACETPEVRGGRSLPGRGLGHKREVVLLDIEEDPAYQVHPFGGRVRVLRDQAMEGRADLDGHCADVRGHRMGNSVGIYSNSAGIASYYWYGILILIWWSNTDNLFGAIFTQDAHWSWCNNK